MQIDRLKCFNCQGVATMLIHLHEDGGPVREIVVCDECINLYLRTPDDEDEEEIESESDGDEDGAYGDLR